ncbi:MAG TPA: DMT family transporter [Candidatus Acetothermia bacterium]|nr:DMT family transporter [Candidatus Acetothermia bacterium]
MATLALVLATAIWGWSFVPVKEATQEMGFLWFLGLRFALASLLFLPWSPRRLRDWLQGLGLGVFLFAGYFFQTWGLVYTTVQKSGLITGLSTVLVPPMARFFGERTPLGTWIGIGIAGSGLVLLVLGGRGPLGAVNIGDLLTVLGAMAYALYLVLQGRWLRGGRWQRLLFPQFAAVAVLSSVGAWVQGQISWELSPRAWEAVGLTAFLASGVSFWLLLWAQKRLPTPYTALILALEPAFAACFGWWLLGERLLGLQLLGAVLIVLGTVWPNSQGGGEEEWGGS